MVLEVGRFMTETSLYFIEANIFRGLSQLSRKTQLCVRAAWTGQSLVFWVLCFLWKMYKKTGHTISQSLEKGVFLVQKPLKADVRVDKSSSFFLLARGARRRIFLFFPGYLVKSLLLRLPFCYIKVCLRLQPNKSRHSLVGHMWRAGGWRGWGDEGEVWVEVCPQGLQFLTLGLIKTKIVQFATLFETRRLNFLTLIHFVSRTELSNSKTVITSWNKVFGKKQTN